jgi:hypothetical protein
LRRNVAACTPPLEIHALRREVVVLSFRTVSARRACCLWCSFLWQMAHSHSTHIRHMYLVVRVPLCLLLLVGFAFKIQRMSLRCAFAHPAHVSHCSILASSTCSLRCPFSVVFITRVGFYFERLFFISLSPLLNPSSLPARRTWRWRDPARTAPTQRWQTASSQSQRRWPPP